MYNDKQKKELGELNSGAIDLSMNIKTFLRSIPSKEGTTTNLDNCKQFSLLRFKNNEHSERGSVMSSQQTKHGVLDASGIWQGKLYSRLQTLLQNPINKLNSETLQTMSVPSHNPAAVSDETLAAQSINFEDTSNNYYYSSVKRQRKKDNILPTNVSEAAQVLQQLYASCSNLMTKTNPTVELEKTVTENICDEETNSIRHVLYNINGELGSLNKTYPFNKHDEMKYTILQQEQRTVLDVYPTENEFSTTTYYRRNNISPILVEEGEKDKEVTVPLTYSKTHIPPLPSTSPLMKSTRAKSHKAYIINNDNDNESQIEPSLDSILSSNVDDNGTEQQNDLLDKEHFLNKDNESTPLDIVYVRQQKLIEDPVNILAGTWYMADGRPINRNYRLKKLLMKTYESDNAGCLRYFVEVDSRVFTSRNMGSFDSYNVHSVQKKIMHCMKRYMEDTRVPIINCYRLYSPELDSKLIYFIISVQVKLPFYLHNNGYCLYHVDAKNCGYFESYTRFGEIKQNIVSLYFTENRFLPMSRINRSTNFYLQLLENCSKCIDMCRGKATTESFREKNDHPNEMSEQHPEHSATGSGLISMENVEESNNYSHLKEKNPNLFGENNVTDSSSSSSYVPFNEYTNGVIGSTLYNNKKKTFAGSRIAAPAEISSYYNLTEDCAYCTGCHTILNSMPYNCGIDSTVRVFDTTEEVSNLFEITVYKDLIRNIQSKVSESDMSLLFQCVLTVKAPSEDRSDVTRNDALYNSNDTYLSDKNEKYYTCDISKPIFESLYPSCMTRTVGSAAASDLPMDEQSILEGLIDSWITRDYYNHSFIVRPLTGWHNYMFSWMDTATEIDEHKNRKMRTVSYALRGELIIDTSALTPIIFYDLVIYSSGTYTRLSTNSEAEIYEMFSYVCQNVNNRWPINHLYSDRYCCYIYDATTGTFKIETSRIRRPSLNGALCIRCYNIRMSVHNSEIQLIIAREIIVTNLCKTLANMVKSMNTQDLTIVSGRSSMANVRDQSGTRDHTTWNGNWMQRTILEKKLINPQPSLSETKRKRKCK